MLRFDDIFIDCTRLGRKISKEKYLQKGKHIIIDQGQNDIAGYSNEEDGIFSDVPVIIFGDHTRIFKLIKNPFFLGADGTKILKAKISNMSYDYLYYYLKYKKIPNTGYNRHFKWLKELTFEIKDFNEQKKISNVLDKTLKILEIKRRQLSELDRLVKFQFLEIFGDPILNEKNWKKIFLSDCCVINPKKNEIKLDDNFSLSFIGMADVSEKGKINTSNIKLYKEVKNGFTYFKENDVLFAKITPCMENGKGGITKNLYNKIGFGSTEFHVLRPIENISNSYWLYYLTMLPFFRKNAEKNMTGSAGQKRVPVTYFQKTLIALPPIELQNKFADFVKQVDKSKFEEIG